MKGGEFSCNPARRPKMGGPKNHTFWRNCKVSKKTNHQPIVIRKPTKKIADPRRIRFGSGFAPAKLMRQP